MQPNLKEIKSQFEFSQAKTREAFLQLEAECKVLAEKKHNYKVKLQNQQARIEYLTKQLELTKECEQKLESTVKRVGQELKLNYRMQGKQLNKVECLICWQVTVPEIEALYTDLSNSYFHCDKHKAIFHEIVERYWPCCGDEPQNCSYDGPQDV